MVSLGLQCVRIAEDCECHAGLSAVNPINYNYSPLKLVNQVIY